MLAALASERLGDVEREHILRVLDACGGNVSAAARRLGIYRSSLQRRLRRYRSESAAKECVHP